MLHEKSFLLITGRFSPSSHVLFSSVPAFCHCVGKPSDDGVLTFRIWSFVVEYACVSSTPSRLNSVKSVPSSVSVVVSGLSFVLPAWPSVMPVAVTVVRLVLRVEARRASRPYRASREAGSRSRRRHVPERLLRHAPHAGHAAERRPAIAFAEERAAVVAERRPRGCSGPCSPCSPRPRGPSRAWRLPRRRRRLLDARVRQAVDVLDGELPDPSPG